MHTSVVLVETHAMARAFLASGRLAPLLAAQFASASGTLPPLSPGEAAVGPGGTVSIWTAVGDSPAAGLLTRRADGSPSLALFTDAADAAAASAAGGLLLPVEPPGNAAAWTPAPAYAASPMPAAAAGASPAAIRPDPAPVVMDGPGAFARALSDDLCPNCLDHPLAADPALDARDLRGARICSACAFFADRRAPRKTG
jgi:hypothetical protein